MSTVPTPTDLTQALSASIELEASLAHLPPEDRTDARRDIREAFVGSGYSDAADFLNWVADCANARDAALDAEDEERNEAAARYAVRPDGDGWFVVYAKDGSCEIPWMSREAADASCARLNA